MKDQEKMTVSIHEFASIFDIIKMSWGMIDNNNNHVIITSNHIIAIWNSADINDLDALHRLANFFGVTIEA